jgi:hypothetical protein
MRREQSPVCEHPDCKMPAEVIHHQDRWAITKKHKNLQSLCRAHHEIEHQKRMYAVDEKMLAYLKF